ncbi:MAG: NTP transferase domain-containing protein [Candidatus Omnitrophota bacterium]
MKAILLAAGVGKRFGKETQALPKCLIPLGKKGENLLARYLDAFRKTGLREVVIVSGHRRDKIKKECRRKGKGLRIRFLLNKQYREGSVVSLFTARKEFDVDCLIMDADVYFPVSALKRLLRSEYRTAFLVDRRAKSTGEEMMLMAKNGRPFYISKKVKPRLEILGENVGFLKLAREDAPVLRGALEKFVRQGKTTVEYEETYNLLMREIKAGCVPIDGLFWTEMDFPQDREKIAAHLRRVRP